MSSNVSLHLADFVNTLRGKVRWVPWRSTNGAAYVSTLAGTGEQARIRELIAVNKPASATAVIASDLHTATWPENDNITHVDVQMVGAAISDDDVVYVAIDAPNAATAASWLSEAAAVNPQTADANRWPVKVWNGEGFDFSGAITRIDMIVGIGSTNNDFDVTVGGN